MITSRLAPLARFGLRCFPRLIAIPKRHRYPRYMTEAVRRWIRIMRLAISRGLYSLRLRRSNHINWPIPSNDELVGQTVFNTNKGLPRRRSRYRFVHSEKQANPVPIPVST
ncbi:hypothetical protein BDP67DRAFT_609390, partial [Colletotrichum lupini]